MLRTFARLLLAAIYLLGGAFLVLASPTRLSSMRLPGEQPAISKVGEAEMRPTLWMPEQRFELITLTAQFSGRDAAEFIGEDYVPPAWGMFIMAVAAFLYLYCSSPSVGLVVLESLLR